MTEIVAEISGNHNGALEKAKELIVTAAICGCQYAKFQYYDPLDMPDRHEDNNEEMYKKLMVPPWWLPHLFRTAEDNGIGLFASVFSGRAARELLEFDVPYIKIASPDSTQLGRETYLDICSIIPKYVGLVVSNNWAGPFLTGLAIMCPRGHPPTDNELWEHLRRFDPERHYGFSDHTSGIRAPLAFIRAGARMIEKHLMLDEDCVDAKFSAHPHTMRQLCRIANG